MIITIRDTIFMMAYCPCCGKNVKADDGESLFGFMARLKKLGWSVRDRGLQGIKTSCPECRKKHTRKEYRKDEKGLFNG